MSEEKIVPGGCKGNDKEEHKNSKGREMLENFDYVRVSLIDFYGVPRGRIFPGRHMTRLIESGTGTYKGALYIGPRSNISAVLMEEHLKEIGDGFGNMDCFPDLPTAHALPWAGFDKYGVGGVFTDLVLKDGSPLTTCTRYVAKKQLQRLRDIGLDILSSYELEFILHDKINQKPVFEGEDIFNNLVFGQYEKLFFQIDQQMYKAGVDIESMHTEQGPGQFEITTVPIYGIEGADKHTILKQGIKEIAHQHGLEAIFMAKPYPESANNGAHFNFSIWDKKTNRNYFYDGNGNRGLSKFAEHWIAGTIKHCKAISTLMSPTVNCYRRLNSSFSPGKIFWGFENRMSVLRVKTGSPNSTYIENRVPSGSCNPYLVLAATIAAGLDGVENELPLPDEVNKEAEDLPGNLKEALECLESNETMVKALGQDFVKWYCVTKRKADLFELKFSDVANPDEKAMEKERNMYNVTM